MYVFYVKNLLLKNKDRAQTSYKTEQRSSVIESFEIQPAKSKQSPTVFLSHYELHNYD